MVATLQANDTHHEELNDNTSIQTVRRHVHEAKHGNIKFIGCMGH